MPGRMSRHRPNRTYVPGDSRSWSPDTRRRASRKRPPLAVEVVTASFTVGLVTWAATPELSRMWGMATMPQAELEAVEGSVYYSGCDEARAAGVAPIHRGSPGCRDGMDGDGDGVACEQYRGG